MDKSYDRFHLKWNLQWIREIQKEVGNERIGDALSFPTSFLNLWFHWWRNHMIELIFYGFLNTFIYFLIVWGFGQIQPIVIYYLYILFSVCIVLLPSLPNLLLLLNIIGWTYCYGRILNELPVTAIFFIEISFVYPPPPLRQYEY
mgnify:CR=1 FL=1